MSSLKRGDTYYVRLPYNLQRPILGGCQCAWCERNSAPPMWDTLAFTDDDAHAWSVHFPELDGML